MCIRPGGVRRATYHGHLPDFGAPCPQDWTTYDVDDVAAGLQEFLISVEMFFAALAHAYAFPPRDYMDPAAGALPSGFRDPLNAKKLLAWG